MADPSEDNNNPGEGTADDFTTWDWHKIMTSIVGYYGDATDTGLSNPTTLYTAANTLEYVKNALTMVAQSIRDQADALSYGDDAPWKGAAAESFNTLMYQLGQNIKANAQVLAGDVAADDIPSQVYANGQRLETAINTIHAIDHWYAQQAIARGVHVVNGLVMVHEDQQVVDAMTHDMRTVITNLSSHYQVNNDGFTPPSTDNNPGPNSPPPGGDVPPPPGGDDNPFGNGPNPFGDNNPFGSNDPFGNNPNFDPTGGGGGGGGGGSNFTPPPLKDFNLPGDGSGGGGAGGGGGGDFSPPPLSNFPGGGNPADLTNFPGGNNPSDLSNFPGGDGANGPGGLNPPPLSNFPGLSDNGANGGANDGFTPPALSNFPGLSNLGGNSDLGGSNSGLNNFSDPFKDGSGLDTSGLDKPGVSSFPGLGDSGVGGSGLGDSGLGGSGLGDSGLGDSGLGGSGLGDSGLANNLESTAPPLSEFPGLGDTTTSGLGGTAGGPGSGMPMMPPGGMGGMGGAGQGNKELGKSDASGLLNPMLFPGDLGDAVDPSGLLNGGGGASGGGGGLSGLDGLGGAKNLESFPGGGGADLPLSGFPGGTDVSDPALANLGGENGLGSDVTGLSTEGLAGGGTAGGPGSGMPMMPPGGMGGMGGAGQGNKELGKSDASGLLNPMLFPGGTVDNAGDPSVLLSGGAGASGGAGGLSGLDLPQEQFPGDPAPIGLPDDGISVNNPSLPVQEAAQQPQQAMPGMPMMPGMGGTGAQQPGSKEGERSDASGLLTPDGSTFADHNALTGQPQGGARPLQHHVRPGGTEHHQSEDEPAASPDRVARVDDGAGAEDFTAWDAGGAASAAVLPWLLGRRGRRDGEDEDLQTDAPAEDNDKWVQGDMRGVPAPAEQQHLATWRPEKVVGGAAVEQPVMRSSAAMPEPEPEPEADPDVAADGEEEEEPERTSADLLDRRSEQWDSRSSDVPGVLG